MCCMGERSGKLKVVVRLEIFPSLYYNMRAIFSNLVSHVT